MAGDGLIPKSPDVALAEWTHLSDTRFGECYVTVRAPGPALEWSMIVAQAAAAPKLLACQTAAKHGFLDQLARAVANWEDHQGRSPAEIKAMLEEVSSFGLMQGITDQQKGFMSAEILMPLLQVRDACAIVVATHPVEQQLGTAFLVRPDLVLTAAHVVMDVEEADGSAHWIPKLRSDLAFRFRGRPNQPLHHLMEVLPASVEPLVCAELPHGSPPNRLDLAMNAAAGSLLDYALVRLAQRVDHVSPVDIVDSAVVRPGKACWAFGFPKGDALMMDVDRVTTISPESGRWLHQANTGGGMSGGCCVNHEGQVVGVHEGTLQLTLGGVVTTLNRGVSITAIRKSQCLAGKDPLAQAKGAPGLEFQDPAVVTEFYRTGKRLVGTALAERWRAQVTAVLRGVDPEGQAALPAFHPWFSRLQVNDWIDNPVRRERLCLVHGAPGVGKSFCAHILKARLDPAKADLIEFNPTQVNAMSWSDAISQILVPGPSEHRTAAASVRYRDFDEVIQELKRRSGRGQGGAGRDCFLTLDFGPASQSKRFVDTEWVEFVAALLAVDWVRVMLIGLEEFERSAMINRLDRRTETENAGSLELELAHIKREELRSYLKSLAGARGWALSDKESRDLVSGIFPAEVPVPEDMWTVTSALAAIDFAASRS